MSMPVYSPSSRYCHPLCQLVTYGSFVHKNAQYEGFILPAAVLQNGPSGRRKNDTRAFLDN